MATKTISLELDAYEKLKRAKRGGESFSEVVRRANFGPSDARGESILESLEAMPVSEADRKAAERWEASGSPDRTISPSRWERDATA